MPKQSGKKKSRDFYTLANQLLSQATGEDMPEVKNISKPVTPIINTATVDLSRVGGLKGGKARAERLTPERHREIARIASIKSWAMYN